MKTVLCQPWKTWFCWLTACIVLPTLAFAQSDNFDSGDISAWKVLPTDTPQLSFPTYGAGKALRVQMPSGSLIYLVHNDSYTDFYVAVDVVGWAQLDQALVLLARGQNVDSLVGATGYVCNFDVLQDGATDTDRRGGEFQINRVDTLATITTLSAAEITLEPGRPYRLVFQGKGSLLTGQIYDSFDLTHPLVTIQADDSTYSSGISGILSYDRGTGGTDVTFDNYYAGASDPNTALAPAIPASVPGTPQVISRTPASRWTNFYSPTNGLTFALTTYGGGSVDAAATKLYLNDVDVSAALENLPSPLNTPTYSLPATSLKSNTVYSARIEAANTGGDLKSTNTFWFDTFSQDYLSTPPVKTIEAEEYNYQNGKFQPDPIPVSGFDTNNTQVNGNGVGYLDLPGTEGVDFHDSNTTPDSPWLEFRINDPVGTMQGGIQEIQDLNHPDTALAPNRPNDTQRAKYAKLNVLEYEVARTEPGEWLNYTRSFDDGDYNVYLRVGSFGSTVAYLNQITSDPTQSDQSTNLLGTFEIPNLMARFFYHYIPLTSNGQLASVHLSGTETVRLTFGGTETKDNYLLSLNYLLFVPAVTAPSSTVTLESAASVTGPYAAESGATIDTNTKTITIPVNGAARFYRLSAASALQISSITVSQGTVTIRY